VKASQHNKKPIVVHIDRVLDFEGSGSEKERTENNHCIGIDLEAEREWARLDREKALGHHEDEEEEEQEVQWHIRRRTAGTPQTLLPSSSATRQPVTAPTRHTPVPSPSPPTTESDRDLLSTPPPPSSSSGTRPPPLLPPRLKKMKRSSRRREAAAEGKPPSKGSRQHRLMRRQRHRQRERERERGAAALLSRAARAAKAEKPAEGPDTGWLDSWTQMGVAI
jgi:hypothetical protein